MDRLAGLGSTQAMGQRHQHAVQQRVLAGQQASGARDSAPSRRLAVAWMPGPVGRPWAVDGATSTQGLWRRRRVFRPSRTAEIGVTAIDARLTGVPTGRPSRR
jgi:hypothetical protein